MKDGMRVGIVGCGGIARGHLMGYRQVGAEVAAVYDIVPEAAAKFAAEAGAEVAESLEQMATGLGLDAVSVCTPPAVHHENCKPFLEAKVGVLCEKPFEASAQTAEPFAADVGQSDAVFMTAFCHRFHPAVVELKKLIAGDVLGRPLMMRNIFGGFVDISANHRAQPHLSGGGIMIDNGSHSSDLFRFLVGDPTRVTSVIGNVFQDIAVEDFCILLLDMGGKAFGEITSSVSLQVCGNWIEWYGTKGTAYISYWNAGHPDLSYRLGGSQDTVAVDCSHLPERFPGQIAHFLECVREGREPAVTAEDGLKASKILTAAYESANTGVGVDVQL